MISQVALRALMRVELRQLRRNAGRSWLIVLLVAVPVAAIVGGSTLQLITGQTAEERRANLMGSADVLVTAEGDAGLEQARELLPQGSSSSFVFRGYRQLTARGRRLATQLIAAQAGVFDEGGLGFGQLIFERGRSPANEGEVALSPLLLAGLDLELGANVAVDGQSRVICGVVQDPEELNSALMLQVLSDADGRAASSLLVTSADNSELAAKLRDAGFAVLVGDEVEGPDGFEQLVIFVVGGLGLLEAALVVAAAFSVGLRRRQREMGLLAATGASAKGIRLALVLSAVGLATIGGVIGSAVGAVAAFCVHPYFDGWNQRLNGDFEISAIHIAAAVLLGILVSVLAVAIPTHTASKLAVREALGGRRPLTKKSSGWLLMGLCMLLLGTASLFYSMRAGGRLTGVFLTLGSAFGVMGFGCCSPWILEQIARIAGHLPLPWRLAVREAGRFRARNGPVVTAILAGMAISVTFAALFASLRQLPAFQQKMMPDDWLLVEGPGAELASGQLADELGARVRAPLTAAHSDGRGVWGIERDKEGASVRADWVALATPELLELLGVGPAEEILAGVELLYFHDCDEEHSLFVKSRGGAEVELTRVKCMPAPLSRRCPSFALGVEAALDFAFESGPPPGNELIPWALRLDQAVEQAEFDRASELVAGHAGTSVDAGFLHAAPTQSFYRFVLLICHITGLIVLGVATALSSVESSADTKVLQTVGAPPKLLRGQLAARVAYLAILGCVLAIPAGMFPAWGLILLASVPLELVLPWPEILITVLGLPVTAYCGAWLLASRPQWKFSS